MTFPVLTRRRVFAGLMLLGWWSANQMGLGYDYEAGLPVARGYHVNAIAVPPNGWYFTKGSQAIRQHEMCHIRRMQQVGAIKFVVKYFWGYSVAGDFACVEERRCGWFGPHPACERKAIICENILGDFGCRGFQWMHERLHDITTTDEQSI